MNRGLKLLRGFSMGAACVLLFGHARVAAGQEGPMRPPTPQTSTLPPSSISNKPEAPPLPVTEMIHRVAAKEDEMARAFVGYTFQKSVRLEEIGADSKPAGMVEIVTQQTAGADGKLSEKPVRRTKSTLHYLDLQRGDAELTVPTSIFPLATSQLPKYDISFQGSQQLDEINAYFFVVKPRALDRTHAYFSGTVWVDQQDWVIVKLMGKWVTETGDVMSPSLPFSVFETYRQQVGKNLWFPAYSRSDESIDQDGVHVPIRIIIRWSDYTLQGASPAPSAAPPATGRNFSARASAP